MVATCHYPIGQPRIFVGHASALVVSLSEVLSNSSNTTPSRVQSRVPSSRLTRCWRTRFIHSDMRFVRNTVP